MSKGEKISREIAQQGADKFIEKYITPYNLRHMVCGSLRRECELIGDVDIVVVFPEESELFHKHINRDIHVGEHIVHIDIWPIADREFWPAILFATGSAKLNVWMRRKAKGMGLKLNQYGLWRGGELIEVTSEKDIFAKINFKWKEPRERDY